ncbi:MAG TPA: methyl-accepting chemotaxis protein [Steroidobacteraceae bacterium]|nr:methyl-accepting chemotaxis protein [Steroidobacteraceae bacterium]
MRHLAKLRGWIGESVSRRLAIPGLVLILLLLVQAALSGASAMRLVGRLEDSSRQSNASMQLTERLLATARELSDHARAMVSAPDEAQRAASLAAFNVSKARLGELVDEISTQLSADPDLQQAVSEGVSGFVVSGVKATRLAERGRIEEAQRELQQRFDPNLLAYVISTVTALNGTSSASLSAVLTGGQRDFWIALGVTGVLVMIAALAAFWAFRAIRGSVIEPVQYAALTARRLATGDYAEVRCSEKPDECGDLVRAMRDLCRQLIERRTEAEAAAAAAVVALRVRSGLDLASSRVLITDPAGHIIYANAAAKSLMDRMQPGASLMNRSLDALLAAADANEDAASGESGNMRLRYGQVITDVVVSAITSESGETLGRVAEWIDRTDEVSAQREVAAVVRAAGAGDFSLRIPAEGKSGYWEELARSLNQLTETFHSALHATSLQLAALSQGALTATAGHRYGGLLAKVFDDLAESRAQLSKMVSQIRHGSENVSSVASTINEGNDTLHAQGEELTGSITEAVQTMQEITEAVRRNAGHALQVRKLATETRDAAVRGGTAVGNVVKSISDVAATSSRVVDVVAVIDEIAFRTNLLALNAAVEAAHAGDHGRGFAVVASEVRNLSQRCTVSAREIKQLIEASNQAVKQGTAMVASAGQIINDVVDRVAAMAGVVGDIATESQQQCADIDGVARKIAKIETTNRENANLLERARDSARELQLLSQELGGAVGRFHVDAQRATPAAVDEIKAALPRVRG